jgi:hypothetical protein
MAGKRWSARNERRAKREKVQGKRERKEVNCRRG